MSELKTITFEQAESIAKNYCENELDMPFNDIEKGYSFTITDVFENGFSYIRKTQFMQCSGIYEILDNYGSTNVAELVTRRFK